jgi:hypothetical protein
MVENSEQVLFKNKPIMNTILHTKRTNWGNSIFGQINTFFSEHENTVNFRNPEAQIADEFVQFLDAMASLDCFINKKYFSL